MLYATHDCDTYTGLSNDVVARLTGCKSRSQWQRSEHSHFQIRGIIDQIGQAFTARVLTQSKSSNDVYNSIPDIFQSEARSFVETVVWMGAEANTGTLCRQAIKWTKSNQRWAKRETSLKRSYIVWLKPSQCADPDWFRIVRAVLPHPVRGHYSFFRQRSQFGFRECSSSFISS